MNKFSYQNALKEIIDNRQLVEINVRDDDERSTAYLLDINDEYLVFARVTNDATLGGVTICLVSDLESIQTQTRFAEALSTLVKSDSLLKEAQQYLKSVKKTSFKDFVSAFKDDQALVDVKTIDSAFTGRIIDFDNQILVLDEFYIEESVSFARTYLNPSTITSITVGGSWLNVVSRSLSE